MAKHMNMVGDPGSGPPKSSAVSVHVGGGSKKSSVFWETVGKNWDCFAPITQNTLNL